MLGSAQSVASLTRPLSDTACVAGHCVRTGTRTVRAYHTPFQLPTSQIPKMKTSMRMMASTCPTARESFQTLSSCLHIGYPVIYLPCLHLARAKHHAGCFRVPRRARKGAQSCWNLAGCAVCDHVTATSFMGAQRTCSPAFPARASYISAMRHALAVARSFRKSSRCL